jgi:hypothetical protein
MNYVSYIVTVGMITMQIPEFIKGNASSLFTSMFVNIHVMLGFWDMSTHEIELFSPWMRFHRVHPLPDSRVG